MWQFIFKITFTLFARQENRNRTTASSLSLGQSRPTGGKAWQAGSWGQDTVLAGTFGLFIRYMYENWFQLFSAYQIIVADAADAVGVNFSGQCKFLQTERENLPFYCVHSMYNVCNLYKCVVYII